MLNENKKSKEFINNMVLLDPKYIQQISLLEKNAVIIISGNEEKYHYVANHYFRGLRKDITIINDVFLSKIEYYKNKNLTEKTIKNYPILHEFFNLKSSTIILFYHSPEKTISESELIQQIKNYDFQKNVKHLLTINASHLLKYNNIIEFPLFYDKNDLLSLSYIS